MVIRTRQSRLTTVLVHLELLVAAAIVIFPLVWIVGASFSPTGGIGSATAIPHNATVANYLELFTGTDYGRWYVNSLIVASANSLVSVVLAALSAYAFSRLRFRGRKSSLVLMLVLQTFPAFLTAIAIYILFLNFGLVDSLVGLIIASIAVQLPYNIWLLKGYMDNISISFDEAALIDGANRNQIFLRIVLPLTSPMLIFVALTQFAAPWMDFVLPRLLISSDKNKTVAIGLFNLISDPFRNDFTVFAAGAVLVALPISVLYIVLQRYLISGLSAGGDKG